VLPGESAKPNSNHFPDGTMLAQGRHSTVKVLPKYTKRATRQLMNGAKKRRASRTKSGHLSE
jgi:hypothetical protein